jgi:endoglucanase
MFAPRPAAAQSTANPVYQGFQTDLIAGVDDGLATGRPKVRHVYLAAPDTLAVVIDAQAIPILPMVPYTPQPGDRVRAQNPLKLGPDGRTEYPRYRYLVRGGQELGQLLGDPPKYLWPAQELKGEPLDLAWADRPASYALSAGSGAATVTPEKVFRKSAPLMREYVKGGGQKSSARHEVYLKFARPLAPGTRYRLTFNGGALTRPEVAFTFDDARLRTEAVHVNLGGYDPREGRRAALLSMWLGSGGGVDYGAQKTFRVVEDATGKIAFEGPVRLVKAGVPGKTMPDEKQRETTDDLPMSVYELDFSPLTKPGAYRVVLPGVGCSFPFRIGVGVWEEAAKLSAHGYLNQRSGIALGPPYTEFARPRDFHPADGVKIHLTDPKVYLDTAHFPATVGVGNPFDRIQASIRLDTAHPDAWGGWHDAADYDRSILPQGHTRAVHAMLDLFESDPAYFGRLNLNLPESKNNVPDLLDEAAWCVDLFRRVQQGDGGVPSNLESVEHPSDPSFLNSLPTALSLPTPETCHMYAAAAAQLATLLKPYDAKRAALFLDSALKAMRWADANAATVPNLFARKDLFPPLVFENLAAVHLYHATGDAAWHERFKKTLREIHPDGEIRIGRTQHGGPFGEAVYALLPPEKTDPKLREVCRAAFVKAADATVTAMERRPYRLDPNPSDWDKRLGDPWPLVVAHRVTGDARYARALADLAAFSGGRNPSNASYTRGLGPRATLTFNLDANYLGAALPTGITTMGPLNRNGWGGVRTEAQLADTLYPAWKEWPFPESTYDIRYYALTEFTVGGVMANQLLTRGYLAHLYPAGPGAVKAGAK